MITNLDPGSELFLANVDRIQRTIATANQQVSSGKKISVASDAPDQVGALLQLRASLQHNSQIQSNLNLAKADATTADSALGSAISMLDQALTLGEQGTNPTQTSDVLQGLAAQVQSIQEQMVGISQTTVQGRYIFSGDQMSSPAFTFDSTRLSTNPVVQLSAASATYRIEDPAGGSFAAAKGATEIFGAPGNVFTALNTLRLALLSGDTTAIGNAIDPIKQASTHLNSMESFYGQVENRIQTASDFATNRDTQLQAQISQTEDADITSAALELTQGSTQLQAALQMQGKKPHTSLFDYLA
jgi:flagellar hook-associated protein 3 FlgL